jgi:pimeloyl-ACP methyl ester carboxylesterase
MLRRLLLTALAMVPLAGATPGQASAVAAKCPTGVVCGSLGVPLDRTGATPGSLTVRFRLYAHTDTSKPPLETIVAAEGGPGYSTLGSAASYLELFAPLRDRHDVLLVDERGTGSSHVIKCAPAQSYVGDAVENARLCGEQLGDRADLFTSAAAADDLADVLDSLHVRTIDLYGDSYGSFFAQTFDVRYPGRVRALVLDGTYPITGLDPWYSTSAGSLNRNFRAVCERSPATCPVAPSQMTALLGRLLDRVRQAPITGTAPDANGRESKVTVDPDTLLTTVFEADTVPAIYREFPAAALAALNGDERPLLRLVAEENTPGGAGAYAGFSEGAYLAFACNDYPQLWDVHASFAKRQQQFDAAVAALTPGAFAPWTDGEWAHAEFNAFDYCIKWPAPTVAQPPMPPGGSYPATPTLIVNGDLDLRTDIPQAEQVHANFPNSTMVVIPNIGHVTAVSDADACSAAIVRRFVATLSTGSTACTAQIPEHRLVARYAARAADAVPASVATSHDRSTADDRRAATVAVEAVADVIDRWYAIPGYTGVGLYGGRFSMTTTNGLPFVTRVFKLDLTRVRWTSDLSVTGTGSVPRGNGRAHVELSLTGAAKGTVTVTWQSREPHASAHVKGTIGGRHVDLRAPAPSFW